MLYEESQYDFYRMTGVSLKKNKYQKFDYDYGFTSN